MSDESRKANKWLLLFRQLVPLLVYFSFAAVYYLNYWVPPKIADLGNQELTKYFTLYGVYAGLVVGFLSLLAFYILLGLKKLIGLGKYHCPNPILFAVSYSPWYLLGRALLFEEKRYTDLARVLIDYFGEPLYYASMAVFIICAIWLVLEIGLRFKNRISISPEVGKIGMLILFVPLLTTGCLSKLEEIACALLPDSDHCYQGSAIQEGQTENCERIKGTKFSSAGSNPPRDKCYLLIAENTGDIAACKQIKGGLMSYTPEECYMNVAIKFEDPAACKQLKGADNRKCRDELGIKIDQYDVIGVDDQIDVVKKALKNSSDPELEKQLKGLEEKRKDMIDVLTTDNKKDYEKQSDPINKDILGDYAVGDLNQESKDKLINLNMALKAKGITMTPEQVDAFKDYYKFMSNPDNDIEKMDDAKLLKDRWNEKVGNVVDKFKIWKSGPSEGEAKLDQQLRFYERMLERQAAIDEGLSVFGEDVKRNVELVSGAAKDKVVDVAKDKVIETIFGEITGNTVGATTKVLGEALDVVKGEAKSKEFRGLVRAYNLGMQDEIGRFGGDVNKAHAEVVKKMTANPYEYEDTHTLAQYGNILENKDCDGSNPHCVNKEVFWKAMKKSYTYQNAK